VGPTISAIRPATIACVCLALAACATTPSPSTTIPSGNPSASVSPEPEQLFVETTVELPLLVESRANAEAIGLINPGRRIAVMAGPVTVGDSSWYRVQALVRPTLENVFGWIPAEIAGSATTQPSTVVCAQTLTISGLAIYHPEHRRRCAGEAELVLEGFLRRERAGPSLLSGEPEWLANPSGWLLVATEGPAVEGGALRIHVSPDLDGALTEGAHTVTAHFNDPAATDCVIQFGGAASSFTLDEQHLLCLQAFVVTAID
jgi:hypothetical protein